MKKSLLIGLTWVALIATTIYAQTATGSTVIARMKSAVANFTLTNDLNPGQTGLQSAPLSGKKTGDILTAGEYNRLLELVSEGGGGGGSGAWIPVNSEIFNGQITGNGLLSATANWISLDVSGHVGARESLLFIEVIPITGSSNWIGVRPKGKIGIQGSDRGSWAGAGASTYQGYNVLTPHGFLVTTTDSTGKIEVGTYETSQWKINLIGYVGSGGGGSGWVDVPLTDTAEFDKSCEYRFQLTPTNTADDPYMGNDPYQYVNAVDNDRLTWFILPGSHYHINFDSKTIYRVNGVPNPDTISKLEKFCGGGGGSGGGMSAPSVISCKKKNSTYATSTLTGQPLVKFTASDCGGTLPDASYNGAIGSLNVCNGAIDHTVYSGGSVNGPWVSFSFRGWYACTWSDGSGYDISVVYMK